MSGQPGHSYKEGGVPAVSYQAVFQASPDGIIIVDEEGVIRDANPRAEELFGYSRDELLGSLVERLVPPEDRADHPAKREEFTRHPRVRGMGAGLDLRAIRKDGRRIPVEIGLRPVDTGEGRFVIAAIRDTSERKRLRRLGVGYLQIIEEERRRIARELHDDIAQCLAALLIRVRVLGRSDDPDTRERLLNEMHDELTSAVEGVRRISRGLRPPALEDLGVETAIRSHLRSFLQESPLKLELHIDPVEDLLPPDRQLVVYRVVQEAVSNAVRHAQATQIGVELRRGRHQIVVTVSDDGVGFDPEGTFLDGAGLGLVGMEERARLVGGTLQIDSRRDEGTEITLRIPLARDDSPVPGASHG